MAWYKCNITHDVRQEDGSLKIDVTEPYVFEAQSVTEAATRITAKLEGDGGDLTIEGVTRMHLQEIFLDTEADTYYLAKVALITLDEVTGSERRQTISILIEADFLRSALEILEKHGMDSDWELLSLSKSPIVEVVIKEEAAA